LGSGSLQHIKVRRSTLRGPAQPATFRPQGLATLTAACSLRARAGFVSYRLRSWDSPYGAFSSRKVSGAFPPGSTHIPFCPSVFPSAAADRPAQWAAVPGFRPFQESLATDAGLARQPLAAPLGFTLLGLTTGSLVQDFAQTPPTRFATTGLTARRSRASRSINQPSLGPNRRTASRKDRQDSPFRVLAPARLRPFERTSHLGYEFTLRRVARCRQPTGTLWMANSLCRSCSESPEVPCGSDRVADRSPTPQAGWPSHLVRRFTAGGRL
jgi:hypothetical protein